MTAETPSPRGGIDRIFKSKAVKIGAGVLAAIFVGLQFVPVEGVGHNGEARYQVEAPPEVKRILQESCYDCHSNEVRWPWYSRIAPGSWLMARDVDEGRKALNFSEWGDLDPDDQAFEKENIWDVIDDGSMPLWFYVPLHPEAAISDEEKVVMKAWLLPEDSEEEEEDDEEEKRDGDGGSKAEGAGGAAGEGAGGAKGAVAEDGAEDGADEDDGSDAPSASDKAVKDPAAAAPAPKTGSALPKSPATPSPSPKAPAPSPVKPAPKPEPAKPPVYTGDKPCRAKSFQFGSVRSACAKGGVDQAKSMMKSLVNQGKAKGANYKCTSCHSNQKTYDNKPNAVADLRKLMSAIKAK